MASRNASVVHGVLIRQWIWPFRVTLWCLVITVGVWAFTVAAQWGWAQHHAAGAPLLHATLVLESEQQALALLRPQVFDPGRLAQWIGDTIRDTALRAAVFSARSLMNLPSNSRAHFGNPALRLGADPGGTFVRQAIARANDTWQMAGVGTGVFATRTAMYAASLPLVVLAMTVSAIDGLVARAKRKACAGRESASLYHRAKLGISFTAILTYLLCLAVPTLTTPIAVLVPMVFIMSIQIKVQCAYYKKYL